MYELLSFGCVELEILLDSGLIDLSVDCHRERDGLWGLQGACSCEHFRVLSNGQRYFVESSLGSNAKHPGSVAEASPFTAIFAGASSLAG